MGQGRGERVPCMGVGQACVCMYVCMYVCHVCVNILYVCMYM